MELDDLLLAKQFSMSYSQCNDAQAGALSPSTSRNTSRSPSVSSLHTTSTSPPKLPSASRIKFNEAMSNSAYLFCLDVAHRDVVGIKADAVTGRVHPTARGIQAPKLTIHMVRFLSSPIPFSC